MIGLVLGTLPDGSAFTSAHVDRFIETYQNEARAIRRRAQSLPYAARLDAAAEIEALEEQIDMWRCVRKTGRLPENWSNE